MFLKLKMRRMRLVQIKKRKEMKELGKTRRFEETLTLMEKKRKKRNGEELE